MFLPRFRSIFRHPVHLLIFVSCVLVLFNEFIIYTVYRWTWPSLKCNSGNCTSILFVADPQILGETFDRNWYYGIANTDADRYLRNTFGRAEAHSVPDVICYMGDLMDEGSVATDEAHARYAQRFRSVFATSSSSSNVAQMHIPGDNDIGGEANDYISDRKQNRFKNAFDEQSSMLVANRYRFINTNMLTHKYPEFTDTEIDERINILLSHMSILSYPGISMKTVITKYNPSIIFSAHMHVSRIITYPPFNAAHLEDRHIFWHALNVERHVPNRTEIMVPTCSYRMGVLRTGYGWALFENNEMKYTVLWSPNRFIFLLIYLGWVMFLLAYGVAHTLWKRCWSRRATYRYRQRLMIATDKF